MKAILVVWILWHTGSNVFPLEGYESLAECRADARALLKADKEAGNSKGGFACFPSDFDPRERTR
jgi:hypothetical protein